MELQIFNYKSPLDRNYRHKVDNLDLNFSGFGLIRYQLMVAIEYFIAFCQIHFPLIFNFKKDNFKVLRSVYEDFDFTDAEKIKEREKITNHDIKAISIFDYTAY